MDDTGLEATETSNVGDQRSDVLALTDMQIRYRPESVATLDEVLDGCSGRLTGVGSPSDQEEDRTDCGNENRQSDGKLILSLLHVSLLIGPG